MSQRKRYFDEFKKKRLSYRSFQVLAFLYLVTFLLPLLVNNKPIVIKYNNNYYLPAVTDFVSSLPFSTIQIIDEFYSPVDIELPHISYFDSKKLFEENGEDNFIIMPLYPYSPVHGMSSESNIPNMKPMTRVENYPMHILGTDNIGRDIFARLLYAFNISLTIAVILTAIEYIIGILVGGLLGLIGGKFDFYVNRLLEIWETIPSYFIIIIISISFKPSIFILILTIGLISWVSIAMLIRAQYYDEKNKDYVIFLHMNGFSKFKILLNIFPNTIIPIVTYLPYSIAISMIIITSLEFLGIGLSPDMPSLGGFLTNFVENVTTDKFWIIIPPLLILTVLILLFYNISKGVKSLFVVRNS